MPAWRAIRLVVNPERPLLGQQLIGGIEDPTHAFSAARLQRHVAQLRLVPV